MLLNKRNALKVSSSKELLAATCCGLGGGEGMHWSGLGWCSSEEEVHHAQPKCCGARVASGMLSLYVATPSAVLCKGVTMTNQHVFHCVQCTACVLF